MEEVSKRNTVESILLGVGIAIESYFLSLIANYIFGSFSFSGLLFQVLAVVVAYVTIDAVYNRSKMTQRKKVVMSLAIVAATVLFAVAIALVKLYFNKLQLQQTL